MIVEIFKVYHALWYHLTIYCGIYKTLLKIITVIPSFSSFIVCQCNYLFNLQLVTHVPLINLSLPEGGRASQFKKSCFKCIECATRTDGFILLLWRRTNLRLLLEESCKRRHSLAMYSSSNFLNKLLIL